MMKRLVFENTIKNLLIVLLLCYTYSPVETFIRSLTTDSIGRQTIIVLASLLIMAFLFASYSFTFKDSDMGHPVRFLDYLNTGITMYGSGVLLQISYVTINALLERTFLIMGILMILFYVSLVLFDFWDLLRFRTQSISDR